MTIPTEFTIGDAAVIVGVCRQPLRQRREWQLPALRALYTFDCWPVRTTARRELLVLIGHLVEEA